MQENPAEPRPDRQPREADGEPATGAGLRWAIALFLLGGLLLLLFAGPSPPA